MFARTGQTSALDAAQLWSGTAGEPGARDEPPRTLRGTPTARLGTRQHRRRQRDEEQLLGGKRERVASSCGMSFARTREGDQREAAAPKLPATTRRFVADSPRGNNTGGGGRPPLLPMAPDCPPGIRRQRADTLRNGVLIRSKPNAGVSNRSGPNQRILGGDSGKKQKIFAFVAITTEGRKQGVPKGSQKHHVRIHIKTGLIHFLFSLKLPDFQIRETHPEWLWLSEGTKEL